MRRIFTKQIRGEWQPRLFFDFDPYETLVARVQPQFTDASGTKVLDVDAAQELLLLAYAAMRALTAEWPLTATRWREIRQKTSAVMLEGADEFDLDEYNDRGTERISSLDWQTFTGDDIEVMLLHDVLLRSAEAKRFSPSDLTMYWSMLCLLRVDRCVGELLHGDAESVLRAALRASDAFAMARSDQAIADARRELARAGGLKRHENTPVQRSKRQAHAIWEKHRHLRPVDIIKLIREQVPDLLLNESVSKWVYGWNRTVQKE